MRRYAGGTGRAAQGMIIILSKIGTWNENG
jgi:hypothetical protein